MRKNHRIGIALLAAVAALALAAPVVAADAADMAGKIVTWEAAYNAGDFAGVAAHYAADGCRMPPNATIVKGREAIQASLEAGHAAGIAQVKLGLVSSVSSGDLASAMGTYEILDSEGKSVDNGKWMNTSKKTADGWKIQCDIWNSDRPLPPATK
jgi:ketosteroid isomerase-like protein